jgi:hypothetical protein
VTSRRPATDAEARALASALRLQILRACLGEPKTNRQIATLVGRDPASTLYHVRTLVRTGFLAAQPVRQGTRGAREIPYLATRKSWQLSVPARAPAMLQAFVHEVAQADADLVDSTRLGLRLPPEQLAEFRHRLRDLLDEFAERADDPEADAWSVFVTVHPDPLR